MAADVTICSNAPARPIIAETTYPAGSDLFCQLLFVNTAPSAKLGVRAALEPSPINYTGGWLSPEGGSRGLKCLLWPRNVFKLDRHVLSNNLFYKVK